MSYNGSVLTTNGYAWEYVIDPYNPLDLPSFTIRLKYRDGVTPTFSYGTAVQVTSSPNVWDLTYASAQWYELCFLHSDLLEVIGANTSSVTDMSSMFDGCSSLTSIPLFDTSSVTNMQWMFEGCSSLTSVPLFNTQNVATMNYMFVACTSLQTVPLFDTSSVTDMGYMLCDCTHVQSGALALYQQASTQATPPTYYYMAFTNCGRDTVTGAAELAQIPTSWGGTMT